jgi:hypothetical protein
MLEDSRIARLKRKETPARWKSVSKRTILIGAGLAVCVAVFMALAGAASASYNFQTHTSDHSMVAGSSHDVTRTVPGANPCDQCHVPHSTEGTFLFARNQNARGGDTVSANDDKGVSTAIKPLCYSCHDATGVNNGTGLATVFSTRYSNHRTHSAAATKSSGTTYGPGSDCDLCHNPHDDGNTSFLTYEQLIQGTWMRVTAGGNFCSSCHLKEAAMSQNHSLEVVPGKNAVASHMPSDSVWAPADGDYSGTRLYDPATHLESIAADAVVECASCHTSHGAEPTASMTTGDKPAFHSLNTMRTAPDKADPSAVFLCLNCH